MAKKWLMARNQTTMSFIDAPSILHLPTEVIQNVLFQHLPCTDIRTLANTCTRLKEISEDHLKRTCVKYCKFFCKMDVFRRILLKGI